MGIHISLLLHSYLINELVLCFCIKNYIYLIHHCTYNFWYTSLFRPTQSDLFGRNLIPDTSVTYHILIISTNEKMRSQTRKKQAPGFCGWNWYNCNVVHPCKALILLPFSWVMMHSQFPAYMCLIFTIYSSRLIRNLSIEFRNMVCLTLYFLFLFTLYLHRHYQLEPLRPC